MSTLRSKAIAEHLSMLASLLEAEAIRANTLGIKTHKDINHTAYEVRQLANRLWEADALFEIDDLPEQSPIRQKGESMLSLVGRQM